MICYSVVYFYCLICSDFYDFYLLNSRFVYRWAGSFYPYHVAPPEILAISVATEPNIHVNNTIEINPILTAANFNDEVTYTACGSGTAYPGRLYPAIPNALNPIPAWPRNPSVRPGPATINTLQEPKRTQPILPSQTLYGYSSEYNITTYCNISRALAIVCVARVYAPTNRRVLDHYWDSISTSN